MSTLGNPVILRWTLWPPRSWACQAASRRLRGQQHTYSAFVSFLAGIRLCVVVLAMLHAFYVPGHNDISAEEIGCTQ